MPLDKPYEEVVYSTHMSLQESERDTMPPEIRKHILSAMAREPKRIEEELSFHRQLSQSIGRLREGYITEEDFFKGLINEGGEKLQTVVRIAERSGEKEHDAYLAKADGKLLIIMPQHQLVGLPILTARVGLNEAGQLTVEEVKAQVFDEKTHQYQEAKGNIVIIDTQGVTLPKKGLGEKMLRTFISYAIPPKEYLEKLNGFATWGGKAKMSESSYGATTPRIL